MTIHLRKILISAFLPLTRLSFIAAASFALIAAPALAQDRSEGVYIKGSIGEFNWINLCSNVAETRNAVLGKCDETATGYGGVIGYRFSPFLGMEAGGHYADGFKTEGVGPNIGGSNTFKQEREYLGYTIGGTGYWPFDGEIIVLSGRAGLHYWDTEEETTTGAPNNLRTSTVTNASTDFYYGGGIEFRFSEHFSLGADYTRYVVENNDTLDLISGKVIISF